MATAQKTQQQSLLSTPLHGLYIPAGLIVVGTAIVKIEWTHYAAALAVVLMIFKVYRGTSRTVLKAGRNWQEFELKEKTEISHNVAMCVLLPPIPLKKFGMVDNEFLALKLICLCTQLPLCTPW